VPASMAMSAPTYDNIGAYSPIQIIWFLTSCCEHLR
jgi:hypothetical protein